MLECDGLAEIARQRVCRKPSFSNFGDRCKRLRAAAGKRIELLEPLRRGEHWHVFICGVCRFWKFEIFIIFLELIDFGIKIILEKSRIIIYAPKNIPELQKIPEKILEID